MTASDPLFSAAETQMLRQIAGQPPEKAAQLLLRLAETYWRTGETCKFAEAFRLSYLERPFGELARLSPDYPNVPPAQMRQIALTLAQHGVLYAPVIAALAVAEAQLGHAQEVRRLVDYERFFHAGVCAPPAGLSSDAFHDAVAAEIKADLKFYDSPGDRAIRQGWRHNNVLRAGTPALSALRDMLQAEVDRYIAALPDDPTHPFLAARPALHRMDGWAVVSGSGSYHIWHIHPSAWITGVYYVTQPQISRGSRSGWLRVGPPSYPGVSQATGWETRMVEPRRGSFVLMPAYFFHETEPMGVEQDRVCIAFETQHGELKHLADQDVY